MTRRTRRSAFEIDLDNAIAAKNPKAPYKAELRPSGFWLVIDARTGQGASYPTDEANAKAEARTLNRAYAEAMAEMRQ